MKWSRQHYSSNAINVHNHKISLLVQNRTLILLIGISSHTISVVLIINSYFSIWEPFLCQILFLISRFMRLIQDFWVSCKYSCPCWSIVCAFLPHVIAHEWGTSNENGKTRIVHDAAPGDALFTQGGWMVSAPTVMLLTLYRFSLMKNNLELKKQFQYNGCPTGDTDIYWLR